MCNLISGILSSTRLVLRAFGSRRAKKVKESRLQLDEATAVKKRIHNSYRLN